MRDKKEVIRGGYGPRTTALGLAQNTSYTTCEFLAQSEVTLGCWPKFLLPAGPDTERRKQELLDT